MSRDVQVEIDPLAQEVGSLAQPGHGRGVDLVPGRTEESGDPLVAPSPVTTSVNQNVRRHSSRLSADSG